MLRDLQGRKQDGSLIERLPERCGEKQASKGFRVVVLIQVLMAVGLTPCFFAGSPLEAAAFLVMWTLSCSQSVPYFCHQRKLSALKGLVQVG